MTLIRRLMTSMLQIVLAIRKKTLLRGLAIGIVCCFILAIIVTTTILIGKNPYRRASGGRRTSSRPRTSTVVSTFLEEPTTMLTMNSLEQGDTTSIENITNRNSSTGVHLRNKNSATTTIEQKIDESSFETGFTNNMVRSTSRSSAPTARIKNQTMGNRSHASIISTRNGPPVNGTANIRKVQFDQSAKNRTSRSRITTASVSRIEISNSTLHNTLADVFTSKQTTLTGTKMLTDFRIANVKNQFLEQGKIINKKKDVLINLIKSADCSVFF